MGGGRLGRWGEVGHSDHRGRTLGETAASSGGAHLPLWSCGTGCHEEVTSCTLLEATKGEPHCPPHQQG